MSAEAIVAEVVNHLVTVVEACGAAIIAFGAGWAFIKFIYVAIRSHDSAAFTSVRLILARFLALGLEFQLAADVLRTAVAPTFRDIGQLAAVAAIRTALNYFLSREIAEERRQVGLESDGKPARRWSAPYWKSRP